MILELGRWQLKKILAQTIYSISTGLWTFPSQLYISTSSNWPFNPAHLGEQTNPEKGVRSLPSSSTFSSVTWKNLILPPYPSQIFTRRNVPF